jgi:hypothetical protein
MKFKRKQNTTMKAPLRTLRQNAGWIYILALTTLKSFHPEVQMGTHILNFPRIVGESNELACFDPHSRANASTIGKIMVEVV